MNLSFIWYLSKNVLAMCAAFAAMVSTAFVVGIALSHGNDAAKARWRPATVAVHPVSGPTRTDSIDSELYVYTVFVETGPLAGEKIKNVSFPIKYVDGSQVHVWIDKKEREVSDSNGYPNPTIGIAMLTVISAALAGAAVLYALMGLDDLARRLWHSRQLARAA